MMPDLERLIDALGDQGVLALGGGLIGILFGALAQRSRFCLRAATLEVAHGSLGKSLTIWLFVFSTALISTQLLIVFDRINLGIEPGEHVQSGFGFDTTHAGNLGD